MLGRLSPYFIMVGTRSQTGNSKPRVPQVIETGPTFTRKPAAPKPATGAGVGAAADKSKVGRPAGVTKKKAPVKKTPVVKTTPEKTAGSIIAKVSLHIYVAMRFAQERC